MNPEQIQNKIPEHCIQWLVSSRQRFFNDLKEGKAVKYFTAHLPVLASWKDDGTSSVNMTVKGVGLIPEEGLLEDSITRLEDTIRQAKDAPWEESLPSRLDAASSLYRDPAHFDNSLLGGLEIFEGQTYKNLRENPEASLLFSGMWENDKGIQYISFQVDGSVEIVGEESIYYRYLLASRRLFEFDKFHVFQSKYPWAYLIKARSVRDKTPRTRGHGHRGKQ